MKNLCTYLLALIVVFSFSSVTFATSGACSRHSGVNCSAGPDYDGSVICNDGNRNSSVSYSSMVKCRGYSTPSTTSVTKAVAPITTKTVIPAEPVETKAVVPVAPVARSKPIAPVESEQPVAQTKPEAVAVAVAEPATEPTSEKINTIASKTPTKVNSEQDGSSTGAVVVILGAAAGAGYLFKKYRKG